MNTTTRKAPLNPHNEPANGVYGLSTYREAFDLALKLSRERNIPFTISSWEDWETKERGYDTQPVTEHKLRGCYIIAVYPDGLVTPNAMPAYAR